MESNSDGKFLTNEEIEILKKLISEGYKLHPYNSEWRSILEKSDLILKSK